MFDEDDHQGRTGENSESVAGAFNKRSAKATEIELKFLVRNNDIGVFTSIETYFAQRSRIRSSFKNSHLLTRQLDTRDKKLFEKGKTTLRVRGTCLNNNFNAIKFADLCVKAGKSKDKSGAIRRGEYEAPIPDFNKAGFEEIFRKYPEDEFPELHKALEGINPKELREFFRIDCYRDRYVIELPEALHGLKGKRFVAELIMDDVAYVMDIPGLKRPLIFYHDFEVECEALFKPCSYDQNPDAGKHVSSPLTQDELDHCMTVMKRELENAAQGQIVENELSKAERGFDEQDKVIMHIIGYIEANETASADLASAFKAKAAPLSDEQKAAASINDARAYEKSMQRQLPRSMAYVLHRRGIATRP